MQKRKAKLTLSQLQYVLGVLAKWRRTNINCFMRASDKPTKRKLAEEVALLNEILGVMRTWE